MKEDSESTLYPRSTLIILDSWTVLLAWFLMGTLILWIALRMSGLVVDKDIIYFMIWLFLFMSAAFSHVALALSHRCPNCSKHPTVEGWFWEGAHPDALPQSRFKGWPGVILNVIKNKRFACIHCGAKYHVEKENA